LNIVLYMDLNIPLLHVLQLQKSDSLPEALQHFCGLEHNGTASELLSIPVRALDKAEELAGRALDKAEEMAGKAIDMARERAGHAIDRAEEMAGRALDKAEMMAGLALDKAEEMAGRAYDKAEEMAGRARGKAGEMAGLARDKAEEMARQAWELMHHHHLPNWLRDNDFLIKGHRPQLNSFWECFKSIFRIHTETGNIWTHLLG
jgi:vacuolar-type H+-ATPase subunit H